MRRGLTVAARAAPLAMGARGKSAPKASYSIRLSDLGVVQSLESGA
jgi:hypothetical protein